MVLDVVILAAGQGKRMRSRLPKVLHTVGGRPLLGHVIDCARALAPRAIHVVIGHGGERVRGGLDAPDVCWVTQDRQLGTGHAVAQVLPSIPDTSSLLVLYGDVPLLQPETLRPLLCDAATEALAVLTAEPADPSGYGRIVRDPDGTVVRIVEQRDASPAERAIREINTGILAAPARWLRRWVGQLDNRNAQGEYYLTDCVALAVADRVPVAASRAVDATEVAGVNDRLQLATVERLHQRRRAQRLLLDGVTLADPARLDVRGEIDSAPDVTVDIDVVLSGRVELGEGVSIGPYCVIRDSRIGAGTVIESHSVIEGAVIGTGCRIGPFAHLRSGTVLEPGVHIGNFVETKNAMVGAGSKANHLSYLGDATVGSGVNIGAGAITCNYDGANKHRTVIEDDVFIGSNTALVAPIHVSRGATVGAGSTLSRDVLADGLTLTRGPLREVRGWKRPRKTIK